MAADLDQFQQLLNTLLSTDNDVRTQAEVSQKIINFFQSHRLFIDPRTSHCYLNNIRVHKIAEHVGNVLSERQWKSLIGHADNLSHCVPLIQPCKIAFFVSFLFVPFVKKWIIIKHAWGYLTGVLELWKKVVPKWCRAARRVSTRPPWNNFFLFSILFHQFANHSLRTTGHVHRDSAPWVASI